ncbi:MAG: protein kinase [Planctomycetes bacterium]|nr:protein kinase [Planctomycetota bacterium]
MIRSLFERALELPPHERLAFLLQQCGGDDALRREIQMLLDSVPTDDFLDPPAVVRVALPDQIGPWAIRGELGRGNHPVCLAQRDDQVVALKVLALATASQTLQQRFLRDAASAQRLQHPHIVAVKDSGSTTEHAWIAMDLIDGHDLARELKLQLEDAPTVPRLLPDFGSPDWYRAVARICEQAASALGCAHEGGIWHRDVKPQNLLLDRQGNVLLTDFGVARDTHATRLTRTGELAGTLHYMSPEQAQQVHGQDLDHRTDLWSLGVVLYELLTLDVPYRGDTAVAVLTAIQRGRPQPIQRRNPDAPAALAAICARAMAFHRDDRYPSAAAMAADLRRFLVGQPPAPDRGARFRPLLRHVRQHRRRYSMLGGAAAIAMAAWAAAPSVLASGRQSQVRLLEEVCAPQSWESLSTTELRLAVVAADQLAGARITAAEGAVVAAFSDRLMKHLAAGKDRVRNLLRPDAPGSPEKNQQEAARLASALVTVAPDDDELRSLLPHDLDSAAVMFVVSQSDRGPPAATRSLHIAAIDTATGSRTPGPQVPARTGTHFVKPGLWRFSIVEAGKPVREYTRMLREPATRHRIDAAGEPAVDPVPMIAFGSGRLTMPAEAPWRPLAEPIEVAPFEIDQHEVSNRQFLRFVDATGSPIDRQWFDLIRADAELLDRPAVFVTFAAAQAYAEWVGKRLPTWPEWLVACGGCTKEQPFPWGTLGPDGLRGAVTGSFRPSLPWALALEEYRAHTRNVTDGAGSNREGGPLHLLGNVAEWTETPAWSPDLSEHRGTWTLLEASHLVAGRNWALSSVPRYDSAAAYAEISEITLSHCNHGRGFRCARSLP